MRLRTKCTRAVGEFLLYLALATAITCSRNVLTEHKCCFKKSIFDQPLMATRKSPCWRHQVELLYRASRGGWTVELLLLLQHLPCAMVTTFKGFNPSHATKVRQMPSFVLWGVCTTGVWCSPTYHAVAGKHRIQTGIVWQNFCSHFTSR